jgi:RNA 3'-terminal phosphate cyclase (ATP)
MKHSALKTMAGTYDVRIESDIRSGPSTGAGIVLAATCENTILAESALGAKGVRSEALGEHCAEALLETVRSGATIDEHMTDQVLPYMALAKPGSVVVTEELTSHAETNIWLIEQFLGKKFSVETIGTLKRISTA